jgi:hypothetical protein
VLGIFGFRQYNIFMRLMRRILKILILCAIIFSVSYVLKTWRENVVLRKVIERLSADSRIAEVVVTDVKFNPQTKKTYTTIKFLEYDTQSKPLLPKYFTFSSNIIQFQSLVIRFDDFYVKRGHPLKGKSAYLFMKVFVLKDNGAEVFEINKINKVPSGYRIEERVTVFEERLWQKFWQYALDPQEAKKMGIKNAQIEAPGTKFIPGILYTLKIEHDGGMRVDASRLPDILKGESYNIP